MALLNLTNYDDHPDDPQWIVFRFPDKGQANEFTQALSVEGLHFEEDTSGGPPFLVGVKQRHRERAVRLNYLVLGRHRQPFIADGLLRWSILIIVGLVVAFAMVGVILRG